MTSDTVPEDMSFPLLRSMGPRRTQTKKPAAKGIAAGGRTARLRGEGKDGARVERALLERRLGIPLRLF